MKEKFPYTYKREKQRFSIRKTKAWGACSVFLGTSILFLSAGTVARADTTADASTRAQVVEQKTTVNTERTGSAESSANSTSSTVSSPSTDSEAEATTPNQNKSTATNTENSASETQSSSQNNASSSSAAKADTTSASSSSATKADTTSASSSSAAKADTTSASSSSATKADTTSASSSSATKADTTSASSSSATKAETTSASSSSAVKAETTSAKTRQNVTKISYNTLLQQLRTSKALATDKEALTHVTKDNFLDYFSLNGSATYDPHTGIVTITPDENDKVGNFSLKSKIDMNSSFKLTGQVNLGDKTSYRGGADGIGFAFHNGNTTDVGNAGGNLGIGGLQNAIGFKLDTWHNDRFIPKATVPGAQVSSTDSNGFGWSQDPYTFNPQFGAFVTTDSKEITAIDGNPYQRWWATTDMSSVQELSSYDLDGEFHNFVVSYDGDSRLLTIKYTEATANVLTWKKTVDSSYQAMAMIISASTGGATNLQQFRIKRFDFKQAATVNVKYVDTIGNQIAQGEVTYPNGANVNGTYTTRQLNIPNYKYVGMDDGTVTGAKSLPATGNLTKAGDNGTVIYVYAPIESKTINETIHYVYQDGTKAHDDYVAQPVTFTREVSTDAVTGEKTYGAWSADQSFDAVTSPELKGYTADKAQIDKQTVNGDSKNLEFTVTYTKNAPTITTEKKTVNETIHYVYKDGSKAVDDHVAKPVEFTRQVSTDAVTGAKTYGAWSADQSFDAVTSPELKGYTADKAQIDKQTVNGDSKNLEFTVTYTKNAPTITTEKKTVNETIHYVYKDGSKAVDDHVAKPVEFTRQVSTDAVTGAKTYGAWSADQSFDAVTSPELKGYTADKAQIDKQTVNGDSKNLEFTVTYTKNAPTITTEKKTVNETIHYVYKDGSKAVDDHVAKPVEFTRQVSTDAVTGAKTYGAWSADQSFDAVTSPELKGYTADKAQIDKQTVNGDSKNLEFTVTYTKNAPTITTEKKTVNETIHYVYKDGSKAVDDHVAKPVEFTRQVSTDAVTGAKTYGAWSADQSFDAVTSPELKGYTADKAQIDKQTVNGDSKNLEFTVTYTKNAPTITTEKKTVNETIHYVYKDGSKAVDDHVAKPVEFTRQVSTDAVTGAKTYGAWSADQSFDAVTSPELKGYTADKAQIDKQTVNGDSKNLEFTVTYTKNAPTITTEKKTVNETIHYVYKDGSKAVDDHVAKPVEFTRQVSTDAVTGAKTYGAWSADQSFDAVTSPELKGYTADKAQIDKQTVNGDSKNLEFTVTYTKNAPTITTEKKTVNETIHYVYKDGSKAVDDHVAKPVEFTRQVSTDAVTGAKTYGAWSADQSFDAVTSPELKGYTADKAQIDKQTVNGDSKNLEFTVTYTKNAPTITTEKKTVNETIHYVYKDGSKAVDDHVAKPVEFTRQVSTDAVTGAKTYGAWSADQSFDAVTSPELKGYTADKAQIDKQTVNGDSKNLEFTVTYTKNAPTITTEKKTVNETIHYVYKDGSKAVDDHVAKPVEFTRQVSTDAVTGAKTYGAWSADQSFDAVTSPELKGYTADKAQIDKQTVNGDSKNLEFTVTYTKNAPTITTEKKTVNETIHYVYKDGSKAVDDHVAKPVEFTRQVSTDAVTGAKTYGAWSADQSFDAVTSPELKGYTADKAQIDKQTVNGDSKNLEFTVTYTKNAPTNPVDPSQPTTPTNPVDPSQPTTPTNPVDPSQPTTPTNPVDPSQPTTPTNPVNPSQPTTPTNPVNPSQPTTPTNPVNPSQPTTPTNPVNPSQPTTSTNPVNPSQPTTPTNPVQAGQAAATNFMNQRLPQTGETDQQHMTLSGLLLLAMSSLLGLFGMTKRQRKE